MKKYLDENGLAVVADHVNGKEPLIFKGTKADWDALTEEEKAVYALVGFPDVAEGGAVVVDEVTEGNLNPVTSNAVAEALSGFNNVKSMVITGTTNEGGGIMIPSALLGHKILMAYRTDPGQDNVCLLTGNNYIVVKNVSDMSAMVQVTMSIKIWYVE